MKLKDFKVLTFDVVGTLINFEGGVLASVRRLGGAKAKDLTDDQIFEPYMRGRAAFPGRSSQAMASVYQSLANELGLPADDGPLLRSSATCLTGPRSKTRWQHSSGYASTIDWLP